MRKALGLLVVLVLFLAGCSDDGTLKITNDSIEEVWYMINNNDIEWLSSGATDKHTWNLSTGIFGEEDKEVTIDYGGDYWFWYDYQTEKTIKPGKTVTVNIIGDAGEIEIQNISPAYYIVEVYLSPSDDPEWGDDDLLGIIGPGESVVWKVTVGYWDILVVDDYDWEYDSYDNYIAPETRIIFEYDGSKRASNPVGDKKANAEKYTEITIDNCEKR